MQYNPDSIHFSKVYSVTYWSFYTQAYIDHLSLFIGYFSSAENKFLDKINHLWPACIK